MVPSDCAPSVDCRRACQMLSILRTYRSRFAQNAHISRYLPWDLYQVKYCKFVAENLLFHLEANCKTRKGGSNDFLEAKRIDERTADSHDSQRDLALATEPKRTEYQASKDTSKRSHIHDDLQWLSCSERVSSMFHGSTIQTMKVTEHNWFSYRISVPTTYNLQVKTSR